MSVLTDVDFSAILVFISARYCCASHTDKMQMTGDHASVQSPVIILCIILLLFQTFQLVEYSQPSFVEHKLLIVAVIFIAAVSGNEP